MGSPDSTEKQVSWQAACCVPLYKRIISRDRIEIYIHLYINASICIEPTPRTAGLASSVRSSSRGQVSRTRRWSCQRLDRTPPGTGGAARCGGNTGSMRMRVVGSEVSVLHCEIPGHGPGSEQGSCVVYDEWIEWQEALLGEPLEVCMLAVEASLASSSAGC